MSSTTQTEPRFTVDGARHPRGLYVLFATEMWERFGFYTMLAMLTLYLQDHSEGFGWSDKSATRVYSNYIMFVYASPLVGGWIAERILGYESSIAIGALFFIAGYVLMSIRSEPVLYVALVLLIVGNGFLKPSISTLVGNLYPDASPRRDAGYTIFYMGINIGAFVGPLIAEAVRQRYGFNAAFGVAGCGMAIGLLIFAAFRHILAGPDHKASISSGEQPGSTTIPEDLPPGEAETPAAEQVPAWKRIMALMIVFSVVTVFWMCAFQSGSTFTYFANDHTDWASSPAVIATLRVLTLGFVSVENVSGVISNSISPFWIIVLCLPLIGFWGCLKRRGLEPSTPTKMAIGMTMTAGALFILSLAARVGGDSGRVSPWWLICAYFILSLGELMLSPMSLSLVSKVAPAGWKGLMMGGWFLAWAIGSSLTRIGVYWNVWSHSLFFGVLGMLCLGVAIFLFILIRPLRQIMPNV